MYPKDAARLGAALVAGAAVTVIAEGGEVIRLRIAREGDVAPVPVGGPTVAADRITLVETDYEETHTV